MVQLTPILPPIHWKYECKTKELPAVYFIETTAGLRGVLGAVKPGTLTRVQKTQHAVAPKSGRLGEIFHAAYWPSQDEPKILPNLTTTRPKAVAVDGRSQDQLQEYFARVTTCLIGGEADLDAAIAAGEESVHVALWNANDPRLPWLPCHRVLRDVDWFQAGWMVCLAREHMFFHDVTAEIHGTNGGTTFNDATVGHLLAPREGEAVNMLAITNDGAWRIHTNHGWADRVLEGLHPALREIAILQLKHILLAKGLDLSPHDGSQDSRVSVFHKSNQALAQLRDGAQVVYLLPPIRSEQLQKLVKHGQMLPAASVAFDVAALEEWNHAE